MSSRHTPEDLAPSLLRRGMSRRGLIQAGAALVALGTAGRLLGTTFAPIQSALVNPPLQAESIVSEERFALWIRHELGPHPDPRFVEILETSGELGYLRMEPIVEPVGEIVLPVGQWDVPDGRTYTLSVVDSQGTPLGGISPVEVTIPPYPDTR